MLFFGLSLGGAIAARRVGHVHNAWATLARLECAIALLTLPAALLPYWTSWIWPTLGSEVLTSLSGRFVKLAISGFVVLPPSTAMGMTLPVLIVAMGRTVSDSPRLNVLVYAFNTLGGAIGLLVTSIWLLPSLGVFGCMMIAALANGVVGIVAWSLRHRQPKEATRLPKRERRRREDAGDRNNGYSLTTPWLVAMACYSGFAVLSLEVVVIRLLSLVVPSSFQATSSVLLTVILLLGIAALLVPALLRLIPHPKMLLLGFVAGAGIASALAPALLYDRTKQLIDVPHLVAIEGRAIGGPLGFHMEVLNVAFVSVGPALLFSASVFPTLLACVVRGKADVAGSEWATLLAINGIGGLVGTIATEQLVLPNFGIYGGMIVVGVLQALTACVAAMTVTSKWRFLLVLPGAFALAGCALIGQRVDKMAYISPHTTFKYEVLESRFGKEGVCCVVNTQSGAKGIMLNNQYLLGTTGVYDAQRRQVLIPLLIHSAARESMTDVRVCCLGLATGISAGAALDFDEKSHVTAVELSPTVIKVAQDHFAEENRSIVLHTRASVVKEDARTYMAAVRDEYDVVAGDLYRPYASGQGRLYSVEHFLNVRHALRDDGIYCQWIPAFQVTENHFRMIAATFLQVFPDALLLCADPESKHPMLGLLGTKNREIDWSRIETRFQTLATRRGLTDSVLLDEDFAKSLFVTKLSKEQLADVRINTLENAILEITAGRHRATYDRRKHKPTSDSRADAYLRGEIWSAFLQEMRQRSAPRANGAR